MSWCIWCILCDLFFGQSVVPQRERKAERGVREAKAYQSFHAKDFFAYGSEFEGCHADFPALIASGDFGA